MRFSRFTFSYFPLCPRYLGIKPAVTLMDDQLPSYESVTQQSPWELVAPFLCSDDLCAAALVCQKWHQIFARQLWGNPASHFGTQNDTVYGAKCYAIERMSSSLTLIQWLSLDSNALCLGRDFLFASLHTLFISLLLIPRSMAGHMPSGYETGMKVITHMFVNISC